MAVWIKTPTAGWIKTPLGTEVDLGPDHFVLDGFPAIGERGTAAPSFRPMPMATVAPSHLLLSSCNCVCRCCERTLSWTSGKVSIRQSTSDK